MHEWSRFWPILLSAKTFVNHRIRQSSTDSIITHKLLSALAIDNQTISYQ